MSSRYSIARQLTGATDDPKVPLHLLVFAIHTAITTLTCIADYLSWPGYTDKQKLSLGQLYVPYLGLGMSFQLVQVEDEMMWLINTIISGLYGRGYVWEAGQGIDEGEGEGSWCRHGS